MKQNALRFVSALTFAIAATSGFAQTAPAGTVEAKDVKTWIINVDGKDYEARPITPTFSGDTGLFHLPSAYTLAKAGLLDGTRATIHWENHDSFLEEFEDVHLTKSVFVVDGNRMTTAGGTSSIDLMLNIIADDHGEKLANAVADQLIYSSIRTDQDTQRLSVPTRIGVRHPKLSQVIQMMESNIEEPISPSVLAKDVGMSTRQLERLFRRYLSRSPKRYYMELRLQKARNLLMQTDMTVINVALACGFASPSHFSKCYRAHYNTTPYRERGAQASRLSV